MPQQISGAERGDAPACLPGKVAEVPRNQQSAPGGGDFQEGQIVGLCGIFSVRNKEPIVKKRGCRANAKRAVP